MKHTLIAALVVMTALVGCNSDDNGESAAPNVEVNLVNTHCPIMGQEVTDDGGRTDYNGETVGFCCPGCIDAFNELDAEAKEQALATKGKGITADDDAHGEHAADDDAHGEHAADDDAHGEES